MRMTMGLLLTILLAAGCDDHTTSPARDLTSPAAPRGVYTVTGDHDVTIRWLANTEVDVAGYRIYEAPCATGSACPYDPVGSTAGSSFVVTGLSNGVTRYFAVAAYDRAGNASDLSYELLLDTPRPAGTGLVLDNYLDPPGRAGYDFSNFRAVAWNDTAADMYFGYDGNTHLMFVPDYQTDIQDAGYASSLDAVDVAPTSGWSPTGAAELIVGHCYVVWTRDDHYAKFRISAIHTATQVAPAQVVFDWAYQVDRGNRELRAQKVKNGAAGAPRPQVWQPREG